MTAIFQQKQTTADFLCIHESTHGRECRCKEAGRHDDWQQKEDFQSVTQWEANPEPVAPSSSDPIPVLPSALTLQVELRWTELQDLLLPPLFSYPKVSNWFCLQNSHYYYFFSAPFLIYVSCLLMHLSWKSAVALTFINRPFHGSHDFFSVQFDTVLMYFYYSIIEILCLSLFDSKKFKSFFLKLIFTPHSIVYT